MASKQYDLDGVVKVVNDVQTFASGFTKREFVVEVEDGKYPQMVKFETVKERTSLLDGLNVGDPVKVFFDIRGNEYQGRYYVNLNAWKIEKGAAGGAPAPQGHDPHPAEYSQPPAATTPSYADDSGDEIPF